jgi:ABC-2 type transport system ATP-binding protein
VERICDGICLINEGRMILGGNLHEIKGRYGRNTVALAFDGDGSFLQNHPLVKRTSVYNSYVEVTMADGADPQSLLKDAIGRVRVSRFEIQEPSLHDIFIERVGATKEGAVAAGAPVAH